MNNVWSSPISDADAAQFRMDMYKKLGEGAVVEEKVLSWAYLLGRGDEDKGSAADPLVVNVIERASAKATAAGPTDTSAANTGLPGAPTTRPQEPKINSEGLVPVGTSILMGGIGCVVISPLIIAEGFDTETAADKWTAPLAADDQLAGVMAAFDCAVIQLFDARNQKSEVKGHMSTSYGTTRVATMGPPIESADGVVSKLLYTGQMAYKDRGWARIQPQFFDGGGNGRSASQIAIKHIIPRSTTWPIRADTRFRVEIMCPSLIGYLGSAGAVACDPPQGAPPPYGKAMQRW